MPLKTPDLMRPSLSLSGTAALPGLSLRRLGHAGAAQYGRQMRRRRKQKRIVKVKAGRVQRGAVLAGTKPDITATAVPDHAAEILGNH